VLATWLFCHFDNKRYRQLKMSKN